MLRTQIPIGLFDVEVFIQKTSTSKSGFSEFEDFPDILSNIADVTHIGYWGFNLNPFGGFLSLHFSV